MWIECKCNEGFEDQLTIGRVYQAFSVSDGSYRIDNDKGELQWYGSAKFKYVL